MVAEVRADPASAEPWKVDGRAWHLSQRAIPMGKRKRWKPAVLLELLGRINKVLPEVRVDWNGKVAVMVHYPGIRQRIVRICTSFSEGLKVELRVPRRTFTPAMYERIGRSPTFEHKLEYDVILTWVRVIEDCEAGQFAQALRLAAIRKESARVTEEALA
jgi:hypothetical protein